MGKNRYIDGQRIMESVFMNDKVTINNIVGDLTAKHPQTRTVFEKFGIDYCCGGRTDLGSAAAAAGLAPAKLLAAVSQAMANPPASREKGQKDWLTASLTELADHIERKHHSFMKQQLPRLQGLLAKVVKAHSQRHGRMLTDLQHTLEMLNSDIETHLAKEEEILFPFIRQIEAYVQENRPMPEMHCGTVQNPIGQMEYEHKQVAEALSRIKEITSNFHLPDDACNTFGALYDGLKDLEADLHEHIHLENNVLFPGAIKLEKTFPKLQEKH